MEVAAEAPRSVTPQSPLRQRTPEEMILAGTRGALENEARIAGRSAEVYDQLRQDRQRMIDQTQVRQQQLQEARAQLDEDRAKAREEYDKAEPRGYWEGRSSGERVLAGLAIGLGAFGSALSGSGRNIAYDIITDEINRDTALQKEQREKLKGKVEDIDNQYDKLFKIYQNETLVENELFNLRAEDAINYLEQLKLEGVQDNVKNQIDLTIGKLQQDIEDRRKDIEDRRMNQLKTLSELQANRLKSGAGVSSDKDWVQKINTVVPEKERSKAYEQVGVMQNLNTAMNNIEDQLLLGYQGVRDPKRLGPGSTAQKVLDETKANVMGVMVANWKGPMTDVEAEIVVEPYLPSITDNQEDIERKIVGMKRLLYQNKKETPLIDAFDILPKDYAAPVLRRGVGDRLSQQQTQQGPSQKDLLDYEAYSAQLAADPTNTKLQRVVEILGQRIGK